LTFEPEISVSNRVATCNANIEKKDKLLSKKRSKLFTGSQMPLIRVIDSSITPCQKVSIDSSLKGAEAQ